MIKKLLIVGYGRHGKDEAGRYLGTITRLKYGGSTSWAALPLMAEYLGVHPLVAWEERHNNRQIWKDHCDELRRFRPSRLIETALKGGDIITGVRATVELEDARRRGLVDLVLWITRPGFPCDTTVEFGPENCDEALLNVGTLQNFHDDLRRWAGEKGLL